MSFPSGSMTGTAAPASADAGDAYSLIDAHSSLDGTLTTRRDLLVEGSVTGTIRCEGTLYVAEGANVNAEIDAASIVVSGTMSGTVRCHGLLEIRETGVVRGQVDTARLTILEGAVYEGHIAMQAGLTAAPTSPGVEPAPAAEPPDQQSSSGSYQFLRSFSGSQAGESAPADDLPGAEPPVEPES